MTVPVDLDAEESVLGAILISDRAAQKCFDMLEPEHFYRESHGLLFKHMADMYAAGTPLDVITVSGHIASQGIDIPREMVHHLASLVPSTSNVTHYARLVKDTWTKREVLHRILLLQEQVPDMPAQDALAAFEEASLQLADRVEGKHETIVPLEETLNRVMRHLDEPQDDALPVPEVFGLDEGFMPGRIYLLAGYPADGKTASAMQFATEVLQAEASVGIASLEMSAEDLAMRWLARETGVAYRGLRRGDLTVDQRARVDEAKSRMKDWRCDIIDDPELTVPKLRRIQRAKRYDLIILDHLHQMRWKDRHDIQDGMLQLLALARTSHIPILILAQLTRQGDWKNPYPPPQPKMLRESGMIEANAAHIWFVWREREGEEHLPTEKARFIVAKNRFGPIGSQKMMFRGSSLGFEREPDYSEAEEIVRAGVDSDIPF